MSKDEELSSNFEGIVVGSNYDQKTTNDTHSVVNNGTYEYNACDTHIYILILTTVTDVAISNNTVDGVNSGILIADMIAKTSFPKSYTSDVIENEVMINLDRIKSNNEISVFKEKAIKAVNITEDNISHHVISQEENVKNNVASLPECSNKMKHGNNSTYTGAYSDICCKVSVALGVCFIIGYFLIPLILYYVNQNGGNSRLDPDHSYRQNKSSVKVCCKLYKDTIGTQTNLYKRKNYHLCLNTAIPGVYVC